jgi:hypothetical protein
MDRFIKEIQLQNATQHSELYKTSAWANLSPDYQALVTDYEDKYISRQQIIDAFAEYYAGHQKNALRPFLLSMIWGFAGAGYGCFRTNGYLTYPEIIEEAIDLIKSKEIEQAFKKLKSIPGLGISFISKILYFASKAANIPEYCLIFDIRVAQSLLKLYFPEELSQTLEVFPVSKYVEYHKYCKFLHAFAQKNKVEADAVELFLFGYAKPSKP